MASITFDRKANAMYVKVNNEKKIKETISLGEDRFMDVDKNGQVIGIEVLFSKTMPKKQLESFNVR